MNDDTDKILGRLTGRVWIDSNRINRLERQLKVLHRQMIALLILTGALAVAVALFLAKVVWHLWP